ncbi:MAG: ribosome small subunit-dependent GTPase A [Balneolaceae bacterium]|nr:ribosome small subunit-dependent GTPase A [Balneolaceae bacterium]
MAEKGRVVESTGSWYEVALEEPGNGNRNGSDDFRIINCRLPGRFRLEEREVTNPVAVGDYVSISLNEDDTGTIEKIHERENYIIRQATHNRMGEQILVANVDRAFVVLSILKPKLKQGFIDRFLVTCEAYEVEPFIVISKMDLAGEEEKRRVEELKELYRSIGYGILATSVEDPSSIESLKEELAGRTSVFIGQSGVGKTTLINKIDPNIDRPTGEVSDYTEKGKHVTTYAKLLPLEMGGYIVDTPGIREFGLVNIEPWELSLYFPEMLKPRRNCKFNNCTHSHEPGCGVMAAFENGEISPERYQSYLNILDSLKED